jgi:hypothetical protein
MDSKMEGTHHTASSARKSARLQMEKDTIEMFRRDSNKRSNIEPNKRSNIEPNKRSNIEMEEVEEGEGDEYVEEVEEMVEEVEEMVEEVEEMGGNTHITNETEQKLVRGIIIRISLLI